MIEEALCQNQLMKGKEGCPKLGGRGLDSVGDIGAIMKEEKKGEGDRGC